MRPILLFLIVLLCFSCFKDEGPYPLHGCITGIHKTRMVKEVIGCWHREIHAVGTDQHAADSVAFKLGLPRVDVSVKEDYTQIHFSADEECTCQ